MPTDNTSPKISFQGDLSLRWHEALVSTNGDSHTAYLSFASNSDWVTLQEQRDEPMILLLDQIDLTCTPKRNFADIVFSNSLCDHRIP